MQLDWHAERSDLPGLTTLDQQLLITEDGNELISTFRFEPALLGAPA